MFFNIVLLGLVLTVFGIFLYTQYNATAEKVPEQNIEFKPVPWYSATRNVREEDYSKPFEVSSNFQSIYN